jgi:hypothetical protein
LPHKPWDRCDASLKQLFTLTKEADVKIMATALIPWTTMPTHDISISEEMNQLSTYA